jgi:peptidoglycan/xylan/chitin deacetylase (PgdA/CDA1 family)
MSASSKVRLVQCWDDGVDDDIRLTDILRKHGATASFNLNIGRHQNERPAKPWMYKDKEVRLLARPELTEVYEGFLVANHTATHPFLTKLPPAQARQEIVDGRRELEQLFGYSVEGFAYPYGDNNEAVQEMVREAGHLYARVCEDTATVLPAENPMAFRASCHFLAPDFWTRFDAVRASGGVFYFWGHSYEILTEDDWRAFDAKIERLGAQGEWVTLPSLFQAA